MLGAPKLGCPRTRVFSVLWLLLLPAAAPACPYWFSGETLSRAHVPLQELVAYQWRAKKWEKVALSIDRLDERGDILFADEAKFKALPVTLTAHDRLVLAPEFVGETAPPSAGFPCSWEKLWTLAEGGKSRQKIYVAACAAAREAAFVAPPEHRVILDAAQRLIASDRYRFTYDEHNHILFDAIDIRWPGQEGWQTVASDANLSMRADVKNFFAVNFDPPDLNSFLKRTAESWVGLNASLTFLLKVLFFTIDLKLDTVVSFYEGSVRIPMAMTMPVKAHKHVHPASGMFYTWSMARPLRDAALSNSTVPTISPAQIKKGWQDIARVGAEACEHVASGGGGGGTGASPATNYSKCFFRLGGFAAGIGAFSMDFLIPRRFVERGFFPWLVADVRAARAQLGWPEQKVEDAPGRIGVYFETSGLDHGEYRWEFWMRVSDANGGGGNAPAVANSLRPTCPKTLELVEERSR